MKARTIIVALLAVGLGLFMGQTSRVLSALSERGRHQQAKLARLETRPQADRNYFV